MIKKERNGIMKKSTEKDAYDVLEMIILKDEGKKEMDRIYDDVIGNL